MTDVVLTNLLDSIRLLAVILLWGGVVVMGMAGLYMLLWGRERKKK